MNLKSVSQTVEGSSLCCKFLFLLPGISGFVSKPRSLSFMPGNKMQVVHSLFGGNTILCPQDSVPVARYQVS